MMAIKYDVQAGVIDVQRDNPKDTDKFLVDSNVWFWMAYPRAGSTSYPYQLDDYPQYIDLALAAESRVLHTGLSLAELSHLIEKTEREVYVRSHGAMRPKEYRHNLPAQHSNVVSEVEAAWGLVKSLAEPMTATIDEPTADAALHRFKTQLVDGYDLFILEAMAANGVVQVITDDGDFATVPGIQVYTSNRNVIQAATSQGRLIVR